MQVRYSNKSSSCPKLKLTDKVLRRRVFNKQVNDRLQKHTILSKLGEYIDKGRDAIDVGAATGHITYYLSPRVHHVYAFEAVYPVFLQLAKMEDALPNVTAIHRAVSNFNGPSNFYVDDKRLSNSGFQDLVGGQKISVETVALDTYFGNNTNIGFLKVDVEGTEFDVLKGAANIIDRNRPSIMVEIYEPFSKYPLNTIFAHLMNYGYSCFYFNPASNDLVKVDSPAIGERAVKTQHKAHDGDFLFVP